MDKDENFSRSTIHSVRGILRPAFCLAVNDDLLVKSLFEFPLSEVIRETYKEKIILIKAQERSFLNYIKHHDYYKEFYPGVYILMRTEMRIPEWEA